MGLVFSIWLEVAMNGQQIVMNLRWMGYLSMEVLERVMVRSTVSVACYVAAHTLPIQVLCRPPFERGGIRVIELFRLAFARRGHYPRMTQLVDPLLLRFRRPL